MKSNEFYEIPRGLDTYYVEAKPPGFSETEFIGLLSLWYFKRSSINNGFIFSIFMITLWSLRILDELLKENQVDWEADIPLNMGQWLSIPMIMIGLVIFIKTFPKKISK